MKQRKKKMKQRKRKSSGSPPSAMPAAGAATIAAPTNAAAKAAPRFALSAKEAAALIKADIEAHIAEHGDDPDGLLRGGFGWRET